MAKEQYFTTEVKTLLKKAVPKLTDEDIKIIETKTKWLECGNPKISVMLKKMIETEDNFDRTLTLSAMDLFLAKEYSVAAKLIDANFVALRDHIGSMNWYFDKSMYIGEGKGEFTDLEKVDIYRNLRQCGLKERDLLNTPWFYSPTMVALLESISDINPVPHLSVEIGPLCLAEMVNFKVEFNNFETFSSLYKDTEPMNELFRNPEQKNVKIVDILKRGFDMMERQEFMNNESAIGLIQAMYILIMMTHKSCMKYIYSLVDSLYKMGFDHLETHSAFIKARVTPIPKRGKKIAEEIFEMLNN